MARIQVAFYHDLPDMKILDLAIDAAKNMLDCEVIHITSLGGPKSEKADRYIEADGETFSERRSKGCSKVDGECLFLGSDVFVLQDVSGVFDSEFDVAIAKDMCPGSDQVKYNADVIFCKNPEFWLKVKETTKGMQWPNGPWHEVELAYAEAAESFNLKVLDASYNYVPENENDIRGRLIHFRGPRKKWAYKWKIPDFKETLNNDCSAMLDNVKHSITLDLPWFETNTDEGAAILVGGGPSLRESCGMLKFTDGKIFALNNTHDYLIERGIIPDYMVILDSREENVQFVQSPHKDVTYLVSAQCHPKVFEALKGYNVVLWLVDMTGAEELVRHITDKELCLVGGGATVGMKTMYLTYLMGFRKLHFFGFDSSYREDENHAYKQPLNDGEDKIQVTAAGKTFVCSPWMAKQAQEFQNQFKKLLSLGCEITVIGDGLIPWIVRQHQLEEPK